MTAESGPEVVVVGVGNVLLGDDGVGVRVVAELAARAARGEIVLPAGVRLVDGGTLGVALLPAVAGARGAVVVDAADGLAPGAVRRFAGSELLAETGASWAAETGPVRLLARDLLAAGVEPEALVLVAIGVGRIGPGVELAPEVAAAVPAAADVVAAEAAAVAARLTAAARTGKVAA